VLRHHANHKMPLTEGRPLPRKTKHIAIARLWVNGLRSDVTPLELYNLDIVSTSNNL
jgi:hypothetical protein